MSSSEPATIDSLVVDAGNLFVVEDAAGETVRDDVLDSDLLAQLAADKQAPRLADPALWMTFYRGYLAKLYWSDEAFQARSWTPDAADFRVRPILLEEFERSVGEEQMPLIEREFGRFARLPVGDHGATLFDGFTQGEQAVFDGSAQREWTACITASFLRPPSECTSVIVTFRTLEPIIRAFTQGFQSSQLAGDIEISSFSSSLDESRYATVREQVIEKLGSKRREDVCPIPNRSGGDPSYRPSDPGRPHQPQARDWSK